MGNARIELSDTGIRIEDLDVPSKDVGDFLRRVAEPDREATLVHAIEVGVFCLERARTGQDLEFVKRQVDSLMSAVQSEVEKIPEATQKSLLEKIGTGDGQRRWRRIAGHSKCLEVAPNCRTLQMLSLAAKLSSEGVCYDREFESQEAWSSRVLSCFIGSGTRRGLG